MDILATIAGTKPDAIAIVEDHGSTITWASLNEHVNRLTNGLAALGIAAGERGCWCGPNSAEVLTFVHAARKLGLVSVPVAYRFTSEELQYVVDNSDATVVVVDAEQAHKVEAVRDRLPKVREVVVYGGEPFDGARSWDEVVGLGSTDEPAEVTAQATGPTMIYTSGTTGKPKGALRTASDPTLVAELLRVMRWVPGEEIHLTTGPLYHSGPLGWANLTHGVGGTIVLLRHFDAERWIDLVRQHRVTNTFTAPTQLKRIVALPDDVLARADMSSMRSLVANAAPVPYALKQEIVAKLGDHFLFEVYGSTELGVDAVLEPEDQLRKPGSCGRTYGSVQVRTIGDDGTDTAVGEPGELFVSTTLALDGYHRTAEKVTDLEGWKSVGDVAYLDDEGYLYICDRKKDMIISGGVNIYPAEIEAVLHAHPDVMDAAVFGVPSEEWGEAVHAVVQPRAGHELDLAALEAHAREQLSGFKVPRSWDVRDQLPRTESGKLLKRVLRDEHWPSKGSQV